MELVSLSEENDSGYLNKSKVLKEARYSKCKWFVAKGVIKNKDKKFEKVSKWSRDSDFEEEEVAMAK